MAVGAGDPRRRRRRVYEILDSADPERGRALRWCEAALELYRADGDVKEARLLLRSALSCVKDYAPVYRTWIAMEARGGGGGGSLRAARDLFTEWGARCGCGDGNGDEDERGSFWCAYLAFELDRGWGGAGRARALAERAAAACPRDAAVRAKCVKAELRLGDGARALAALYHALADLAGDTGAQERLVDEVRRYGDGRCCWRRSRHGVAALRGAKKWLVDEARGRVSSIGGGERSRHGMALPGCLPFSRPPRGYTRLRDAAAGDESP